MKRTLLAMALLLGMMSSNAQEIKTQEVTADDYIQLLENMGYKVYSFDISEFKDVKSYEPVIKQYKQGDKDGEFLIGGEFAWSVNGVQISNVKISFSPTEKGKEVDVRFDKTNGISIPLEFEGQTSPEGEVNYSCALRTFKQDGTMIDDFYPLALLGAYWYDPDSKVFRLCGAMELTSELKESVMKYIPEYFIIGVRLRR